MVTLELAQTGVISSHFWPCLTNEIAPLEARRNWVAADDVVETKQSFWAEFTMTRMSEGPAETRVRC